MRVIKLDFFRCRIEADEDLILALRTFLRVEHEVTEWKRIFRRGCKPESKRIHTKQFFQYYKPLDNKSFIIHRGYLPYLILFVKSKRPDFKIEESEVSLRSDLVLRQSWIDVLGNWDERQLDEVMNILKYKSGLVQLPTGFGKGEMISAVVDTYLDQKEGNVLVLVPKKSIQSELEIRLHKKYKIAKDRVKIINPVGFLKTNAYKNGEFDTFLNDVTMVITDEVHHMASNSYVTLFKDDLRNVEYSYGFSATIDSKDMSKLDFRSWSQSTQEIVGMTGLCLSYKLAKDLDRKIEYYRLMGNFGKSMLNEEDVNTNYQNNVADTCMNPNFLKTVINLLDTYSDRVFYMPVPFIEAGDQIHSYLVDQGINSIHWHAGNISANVIQIADYEHLKEEMKTRNHRLLIATSASNEGVDIPAIDAVILPYGVGEIATPQCMGRATRTERAPLVFNVFNEENPVLRTQGRKREDFLKAHYEVSVNTIKVGGSMK